jgi:hypothetical protein
MDLESKIDDLYRLPPGEFTAARNVLAKTLTGDAAKRVKSLAKPTLVPWAVNQLYWKSKAVYERLMKSGDGLRSAQIAALKGRGAEVQRASEAHKKALADALREATKIAAAEALNPGSDDLSRMLETLSLAPADPEHPGRFTELIQPAGFEALAGVGALKGVSALKAVSAGKAVNQAKAGSHADAQSAKEDEERERAERAAEIEREREAAKERKEAEAQLKAAEQKLERARAAELKAREAYDSAQEDRRAAEAALFAARKVVRDL